MWQVGTYGNFFISTEHIRLDALCVGQVVSVVVRVTARLGVRGVLRGRAWSYGSGGPE